MKKSLIALAALAAVSAASAQSSVTLYGLVDIGYGSHTVTNRDGSGSIRSSGVMDGANAGNRIGFRGTEDLGGGLKANFVVEQGISPTSGALFGQRAAAAGQQGANFNAGANNLAGAGTAFSASTNRQSYLGLSSSIGTFNIGYQYTNLYELATLSGYNIGTEGVAGAYTSHLFGAGVVGGARANGFTYISPAFGGGFTVRAQYGANGATTETSTIATAGVTTAQATGRRYSLMGQYANGPISAAASYTNMRSTTVPAVNTASRTANLFQLGASYDFGVVKLAGTYNNGKDGGTAATTVNSKYRSYQLGLSAPFGAFVPFITFGRAYQQLDGAALRANDYKQQQIGVRYSLSKRTTAYAFYGQTTDDAATVLNGLGYRDKKTIVGLAHSF